ncbi:MAG: hypothetical protein ABIF92_03040 [archaeon]
MADEDQDPNKKLDISEIEKAGKEILQAFKHKVAHNMFALRHRDLMHTFGKVDRLMIKQDKAVSIVKSGKSKKLLDTYKEIGELQGEMDAEFITIMSTLTSLLRGFVDYYDNNRLKFFEDYINLGKTNLDFSEHVSKLEKQWPDVQKHIKKFTGHAGGIVKDSMPQGAFPLMVGDLRDLAMAEGFSGWQKKKRQVRKGTESASEE